MHTLLHLLLIFGFVVFINCQINGGRPVFHPPIHVGSTNHGGSSNHGGSNHGGELALIPIFVFGVICGIWFCLCQQQKKGKPSQNNGMFVASNSKDVERGGEEFYLIQSGTWSCRYFQHGSWYGPHLLSLSIDNANMTIKGSGTDNVGTFTVKGLYSNSTRRIGLTKHYQFGTGNPNLGHDVTIQLTYNPRSNQFEGKWYIQTHKYSGQNRMELKFVKPL